MGAAALRWIHDDSNEKRFVDHWNNASLADRTRLLKDAGRDTFHKHKAWAAVPHDVKVDVVTIIKRNHAAKDATATTQNSIPNPKHWYNQERF